MILRLTSKRPFTRSRMRARKFIFVLLTAGSCLLLLIWLGDSKFRRFKRQSLQYHKDFAAACDSILSHYPLGTNGSLEIPAAGGTLPEIILALHPSRIKVSTNWVWILVDGSHTDGLAVVWEPQDETHTNRWNLVATTGEGPSEVIYVATR